jgi:ABC-type uncharacterized transport system involved in gliding motility auxiliary subunit
MVNYFSWKYYKRFDWTSQDLYTLTEKSRNVVGALDTPIEAVVFVSPGEPLFEPVQELLTRYAAESSNFSMRVVDPEKNLVEAQALVNKFELSHLDVIVFDRGDDRRVIESSDLAEYDYSGLQAGRGPEMTGFKGEQVFTGAIVDLAEDRKPKTSFTTGHGELGLDDPSAGGLTELEALLGRDNFDLEEWSPLSEPEVPEGTDAVVIAGPTAGFAEPEVAAIEKFVKEGGRLWALIDPLIGGSGAVATTGLEGLLSSYGVELGSDIVIDPKNPIPFFGAETFFVTEYGDHPITRPLRQAEVPVIVPLAQSLRLAGESDEFEVTVLLKTSPDSWGERDLENLGAIERGEEDTTGPVTVAVAIETESPEEDVAVPVEDLDTTGDDSSGTEPKAEGIESSVETARASIRMVVSGDADFVTNGQLRNVGNAELAANTVNWLVERENLIAIPPKKPEQVRLSLSGSELRSIGLLVFLVLPGLALVAGAAVYSRRRR